MLDSYSFGMTPKEVITKRCQEQCPDGYPMCIRSRGEWAIIAQAVNEGIDSHLEAVTVRSSFDSTTGKCLVHPEELHVLLRRLSESESAEAWSLRVGILSTLDIEEI